MNIADSSSLKCFKSLACIGFIGFGLLAMTNGQNKNNGDKDHIIRIGVEEVRLDAVVLDRKGRQITDLTVNDFEIRQGGVDQKLTSATYINEYQAQPKIQTKQTKLSPSTPVPMLTQEEVHRTIVFVVDNYSMDFVQFCDARMALKKFVQAQMQPGDLVAIVPTAGGATEFQAFTSDKQHLYSIIDNLHWMDIHQSSYKINMDNDLVDDKERRRSDDELKGELYMATSYCIKALRNMPGRKSLFIISNNVWITYRNWDDYIRLQRLYNELADAALRTGVVVHSLDLIGLIGLEQTMPDFSADKNPLANATSQDVASGSIFRNRLASAAIKAYALHSRKPLPLSEKTGGLFVTESNFFVTPSGIGRASEMIKGYYLLTYIPPFDTFSKDSKNAYTDIQVKVKRPGCEVHTRNGFFRTPGSIFTPYENISSLQEAIYSPFRYNDLKINIVSGFIDDSQKGYLLQSSLHVDAKDLNIDESKNGKRSISLEGVCITSNIDNVIQDSSAQHYDYSFTKEEIPWIKEHGLRYSIALPVKKPGSYYVRAAMKDLASGKIGSAYQFIEIPDLKKGRLTLSNIFIVNRDEDLPWLRSESAELSPDVKKDSGKSAAIQNYAPGETIEYAAVIYNAKTSENQKPDLESQFTLFGNGKELAKGNAETVDLNGVRDFTRIPMRKKLALEQSLQPGDYILLLQITDKLASKNKNLASQSLSFKLTK